MTSPSAAAARSTRIAMSLALALLSLAVLPPAAATDAAVRGVGATLYAEKGMVAVATDDGLVGTSYDFDGSDGETHWIVKACYEMDAPSGAGVCVREDIYWTLLLLP